MTFSQFLDKALWLLLVAVAGYAATQIQYATASINTLNEKMAVVIFQLSNQSIVSQDHESRIRALETKRK